ncbi:NAD(P)-binding protein [Diplogelasinospora grovesii]|uniref:NAD(P)-binding protein n=1 Tax=Diplogelasinospora grovesii TaxID=303347 RepID=A0AAN6RY83_9PEZI|nr:NAD(P)-binding protein [Diplogelasinospora grovesii]
MATAGKIIVLITGANTGIGWETAKALLQSKLRTYHILLGTRSVVKGEDAIAALRKDVPDTNSTIEALQVDVSNDDSINSAFAQVESTYGRVDSLINNAGISLNVKLHRGELSLRETWNQAYDVNVSGAHVMTHTFVPLLLKSADPRLIFITSGLSTMQGMAKTYAPGAVPMPSGWPKPITGMSSPDAYRASKAALNMMMLSWHWKLMQDGVKVWCLAFGDQEMLFQRGAGHPSIGGQLITSVVEGQRDADVGKVVSGDGIQPF